MPSRPRNIACNCKEKGTGLIYVFGTIVNIYVGTYMYS
jgi:hypothetical protein